MTLFLGIDGGGTGCRAVIGDADGRILGRGLGGPANINTDVEAAARHIMQATAEALRGPGVPPQTLIAGLGLAGGTMQAATARLTALLPFRAMLIVNDAISAARGALGARDGILAAIGTGSVFAIQRAGSLRQVGGRGFLMGDEGSGAVLGRQLLADAMRAEDGFLPMTPLLRAMLDRHGGPEGIIGFGNRATPADFAALAPLVVAGDDPAARRIFDRAVEDLRHILTTLQAGGRLPVVFLGGLGPSYAARLDGPWPVVPAAGDGLDGALQLARALHAEGAAP